MWVAQFCLTLWNPVAWSPPDSSVRGDSPGKDTGVGCHALLQGGLPHPGIKPRSPALQAYSLLSDSPGNVPKSFVILLHGRFYYLSFLLVYFHACMPCHFSCVRLSVHDLMDCSPLGSSVHRILQARILEWAAIPFSRGVGLPAPGIEPGSPALQADSLPSEPPSYIFIIWFGLYSTTVFYSIAQVFPVWLLGALSVALVPL